MSAYQKCYEVTLMIRHRLTGAKIIERTAFALSFSDLLKSASKFGDLRYADLSHRAFRDRIITLTDFSHASVESSSFTNILFAECEFNNCLFDVSSSFERCNFFKCTISEDMLKFVSFKGCSFDD
jgi:uncharacterized protein YjbI with pentapeptide repeats